MEGDQHIYLGELAALLAFFVLPPLVVALPLQFAFLVWRGVRSRTAWASLLSTAAASVIVTFALFVLTPAILPSSLGVRDINIGHRWLPILPLAFAVVATVTAVVSFLTKHRASIQIAPNDQPLG